MPTLDLPTLRRAMKGAARQAIAKLRAEHPDETFYTFALCCDDEQPWSICPSATTEEGHRGALARAKARSPALGEAGDATRSMYRWHLPEWRYHGTEAGAFRALDPLLFDYEPDIEDDEPTPETIAFLSEVAGTMILSLADLDREGAFGTGDARNSVTLLCDLVQAPDKPWYAVESARRLNPPAVFESFYPEWLSWLAADEVAVINHPDKSRIYRPLLRFLERSS